MKLFTERGFDNTSLQDIIDDTKLSKGAIYHHFTSKEEILETIFERIGEENSQVREKIRDDKTLNAIEKMKKILKKALFNSNQSLMLTITPRLLDNPHFSAIQIRQLYQIVAPKFIQSILQKGIKEDTIRVENPSELAESIIILSNIWLNSLVSTTDKDGMIKCCKTFNKLLEGIGIENFLDDKMTGAYTKYFD